MISRFIVSMMLNSACLAADTANAGAAPATLTPRTIALPEGETMRVKVKEIRAEGNVRSDAMTERNGKRLAPSLIAKGYLEEFPMHLEQVGKHDFLLLGGFGRFYAMTKILTPAQLREALKAFGGDSVPAKVYRNLTPQGREAVRAHDFAKSTDKMPNDEWGDYLIVKKFRIADKDLTESEIAEFMGWFNETGKNAGQPNRSRIQPRIALADLSHKFPELETEYRKVWDSSIPENERITPFKVADILPLKKAAGLDALGTGAKALIEEIKARPVGGAEENPNAPKRRSATDCVDACKRLTSPMLIRALYAWHNMPTATGKPVETLDALNAEFLHPTKADLKPVDPAEGNGFDATGEPLPPDESEREGSASASGKGKPHGKPHGKPQAAKTHGKRQAAGAAK